MNKTLDISKTIKRLSPLATAIFLATLTACASNHVVERSLESGWFGRTQLNCPNAHSYRGKVVGDGHCVSLIKRCSGAPNTNQWLPGEPVLDNSIAAGTIIATFDDQRYPSAHGYHAAIYIEQDEQGIWVWDQWLGKPVHRRLIRIRQDSALASNTAQAYRVVTISQ